jgi:hypothetical protein
MILFNRFWTERQAGLKRTAGYPTDAGRFKTASRLCKRNLVSMMRSSGASDETSQDESLAR